MYFQFLLETENEKKSKKSSKSCQRFLIMNGSNLIKKIFLDRIYRIYRIFLSAFQMRADKLNRLRRKAVLFDSQLIDWSKLVSGGVGQSDLIISAESGLCIFSFFRKLKMKKQIQKILLILSKVSYYEWIQSIKKSIFQRHITDRSRKRVRQDLQ